MEKIRKNLKTGKDERFFLCLYCEKERLKKKDAEQCVKDHELILVPIARNDLGRLQQFFYLKEEKLLSKSLINTVSKYAREAARR